MAKSSPSLLELTLGSAQYRMKDLINVGTAGKVNIAQRLKHLHRVSEYLDVY